jgi:hypothetical protein
VPGFFYVDPTHNSSTDLFNDYGYPGKPRKSIPVLLPGSYVEMHGRFGETDIEIQAGCSSNQPCWIRGLSKEDRPVITGRMWIRDSSYLVVENLEFNGGSGSAVKIVGDSKNVSFRNSMLINREQPGGAAAGVGIKPDTGKLIENIVIFGNRFEKFGDSLISEDRDFHGVTPSLWGRDSSTELRRVWILENYCALLSGDCVQVNAGNWEDSHKYLHHIYIGKNESYSNRQNGYWVKQGSDVIISQNKAWGNYGTQAGTGVGFQYAKQNLWIIYNELFDSAFGIRQSDTPVTNEAPNIYMIGNLIYNINPTKGKEHNPSDPWNHGTAIALWAGHANRFVINNTIHNVHDGVTAIYSGPIEMSGNIISQKKDHPDSYFFHFSHPARKEQVWIDHNLFLDDSTERYFGQWPDIRPRMDSLAQLKEIGQCEGCFADIGEQSRQHFQRPTIDPETRDFHLTADSTAVHGAVRHSAYDTFFDRYGLDIYVDFDGYPRPAERPSIGAFELHETTAPRPPSNVHSD